MQVRDSGQLRWCRCLSIIHLYDTDVVNARFALFVASLMVIGAIVIVNVTIFNLHLNSSSSDHITLAEIAGIISLIFSGTVIVVAFAAFILGLFSRKMRISLKEYYYRVTTKEKDALNTYHHV